MVTPGNQLRKDFPMRLKTSPLDATTTIATTIVVTPLKFVIKSVIKLALILLTAVLIAVSSIAIGIAVFVLVTVLWASFLNVVAPSPLGSPGNYAMSAATVGLPTGVWTTFMTLLNLRDTIFPKLVRMFRDRDD